VDVLSTLKKTRLVETFSGKDLSVPELLEIIDAARWAISFQGMQSWEVVVVKEDDRKKALSELVVKGELKRASFLLVICANLDRARFAVGEKGEKQSIMEVSAFAQNIVTASRQFGISCSVLADFNPEKVQEFIESPKGVVPVIVLGMGFASQHPEVKRVPITTFVHTEKFGKPWEGALVSKFSDKSNKGTFMHIFSQ
jgi:nitroreductase